MADKVSAAGAAVEDTKKMKASDSKKKSAPKKKVSALDSMIAEAKAAFGGDLSTTGERKLRKRPDSSRSAGPVAKKPAKKAAAAKTPKKKAAVNGASASS